MPSISLDAADAVELRELLEFLGDWLAVDRDHLSASLGRFAGSPGYDLDDLRSDLSGFAFLLGGDGEDLFGVQPG